MTTSAKHPDDAPWSPDSIVTALADPTTGLKIKDRLRYEPSGDALVEALRCAHDDRQRKILCDILGDRHEHMAVAELIQQLANDGVRSSAADALAKIKDPAAGIPLAYWFTRETVTGTRAMLAAALGAVGHVAAIPDLVVALLDENESVRGSAAWSLGHLRAYDALVPLKAALSREPMGYYARARMEEAIEILSRSVTD